MWILSSCIHACRHRCHRGRSRPWPNLEHQPCQSHSSGQVVGRQLPRRLPTHCQSRHRPPLRGSVSWPTQHTMTRSAIHIAPLEWVILLRTILCQVRVQAAAPSAVVQPHKRSKWPKRSCNAILPSWDLDLELRQNHDHHQGHKAIRCLLNVGQCCLAVSFGMCTWIATIPREHLVGAVALVIEHLIIAPFNLKLPISSMIIMSPYLSFLTFCPFCF
mmetsp:Transcript_4539/g.8109  ORF Transcript_4539/g.8109 Transcript_4539/m.8109 type:complete len:217 (+) Transcript_4539:564-1214(+)